MKESRIENLSLITDESIVSKSSSKKPKIKAGANISYPARLPILSNSVENGLTNGKLFFL